MNNIKECLSYDDCLLVPNFSDIEHRADISLESSIGNGIVLSLPIISSPMDTVTEDKMADAMLNSGGLGIIHRYNTIQKQADLFSASGKSGCAIGVAGDYMERASALYDVGCRIFCIDVAHGHSSMMKDALMSLTAKYNDIHIMAGNVATKSAFESLSSWGANSIRVGIGNGSCCSTQIKTGFGVPSLSSIIDCYESINDNDAVIIADGGIKGSSDIVKALAAGASAVMLGSLLSGARETPGELFEESGELWKSYRGMASKDAQMDWRGKTASLEGIATKVRYKGPVVNILNDLETSIRSGLSYNGSRNLAHLRIYRTFIKRTGSSILESSPHILTSNI